MNSFSRSRGKNPHEASDGLARELDGTDLDVHLIGDAQAPRRIFNAIWEGEVAARRRVLLHHRRVPMGRRGTRYRVTIAGRGGSTVREAAADREGRLTIPVELGPGNPHQHYSPAADEASTGPSPDDVPFYVRGNSSRFYTSEVSIFPTSGIPG
ncbi:hypothetical protein GCM10010191_71020 [Actinomadura vinacea]|uniref:Uncharacterized protein n=1 Tax=Actinomadura vinacea TaxID=115336 RepID=A0ABN3JZE2_9ACTN